MSQSFRHSQQPTLEIVSRLAGNNSAHIVGADANVSGVSDSLGSEGNSVRGSFVDGGGNYMGDTVVDSRGSNCGVVDSRGNNSGLVGDSRGSNSVSVGDSRGSDVVVCKGGLVEKGLSISLGLSFPLDNVLENLRLGIDQRADSSIIDRWSGNSLVGDSRAGNSLVGDSGGNSLVGDSRGNSLVGNNGSSNSLVVCSSRGSNGLSIGDSRGSNGVSIGDSPVVGKRKGVNSCISIC